MDISSLFIEGLGGTQSWPPLNNYSLFVFGSGYNTKRFNEGVYESQPNYCLLTIRYKGNSQTFISEHALHQYSVEALGKYLLDSSSLTVIEDNFYKNFPTIDDLYNRHTYEYIAGKNEEELLPIASEAFDLIWQSNAWSHYSLHFDFDICLEVLAQKRPDIARSDIETMWQQATSSIAESFDKEQRRDFLQALQRYGNSPALIEHCQYFYASYRKVYDLAHVKQELQTTYAEFLEHPEKAARALEAMDEEDRLKKQAYRAWQETLSEDQKLIADYCQSVMRVRDQRKNFFAKGFVIAWRIAEKVFASAGVEASLIENIRPFEELSKGSAYVASLKKELELRVDNYAVFIPYEGEAVISHENIEEEYKQVNDFYLEGKEKQSGEIIGRVGNKGVVTGNVRVIKSTDDFASFQEGEILVTGMTRPEFVPLMRKAKAIVTDEGGITCHAAIVSRELNKPCVIGTKFATHILKDGDMVEVNADKGIITLIR